MRGFILLLLSSLTSQGVRGVNFPYELIELTNDDVAKNPAIDFGNAANITNGGECKAFPGNEDWPLWPADAEWSALNNSLEGALLKPLPVGAPCYQGPNYDADKCRAVLRDGRATLNDPITVLTAWPQGDTCLATANPVGNCTQGGYPVYVVNVTTAKHVQAGVNFARNNHIRLIIK